MARPKQTHCLNGHELTEENRGAEGRCKQCDRDRWHNRQRRLALRRCSAAAELKKRGGMMTYFDAQTEIKRENENAEAVIYLKADLEIAMDKLKRIEEIVNKAPELNMSNFDIDQVAELNNAMIEIWFLLQPDEIEGEQQL